MEPFIYGTEASEYSDCAKGVHVRSVNTLRKYVVMTLSKFEIVPDNLGIRSYIVTHLS